MTTATKRKPRRHDLATRWILVIHECLRAADLPVDLPAREAAIEILNEIADHLAKDLILPSPDAFLPILLANQQHLLTESE